MIKMIPQHRFDQPARFRVGEFILGLALEMRVGQKHRQHNAGFAGDIFRAQLLGAFIVGQFTVSFEAA